MSSNSQAINSHPESGVHRLLGNLFTLSTVLFIVGGAAIVVLQAVLLIVAEGTAAREIAEAMGPYVFGTSSVAGLLAFVLTYFKNGANPDGE
jgi:hypothetical protein